MGTVKKDLLELSPTDPAYFSLEAQRARVQHLLEYTRQHAPDPQVEDFLVTQLREIEAKLEAAQ